MAVRTLARLPGHSPAWSDMGISLALHSRNASACSDRGYNCSSPAMSKPQAPVSTARRAMSSECDGGKDRNAHTITFAHAVLSSIAACTASTAASGDRPCLGRRNSAVRLHARTAATAAAQPDTGTHSQCRVGQNLISEYTCERFGEVYPVYRTCTQTRRCTHYTVAGQVVQ